MGVGGLMIDLSRISVNTMKASLIGITYNKTAIFLLFLLCFNTAKGGYEIKQSNVKLSTSTLKSSFSDIFFVFSS
jgi:hypothetical protein